MPYLAMELLAGQDLAAILSRLGPLGLGDALDLLVPVIAAVAAAHDAGVVHRDLKPSNVFIAHGPGGRPFPKVLDFGVSRVLADAEAELTAASRQLVGTVTYMAPEQAADARNASFRSDQYSLAMILVESLTGQPRADLGASEIPGTMCDILARALRPSPDDRFPSVRSVGDALLPFASERTRLAWSAELGGPASRPHPVFGETAPASVAHAPTIDECEASSLNPGQELRVLASVDGFIVGEIGRVCAVIWRAPVTRERFDVQSAGLDRVMARHPEGAGFLCIIETDTVPPPSDDLRRASTRMIAAHADRLKYVACVVEGTGFKAAAARSVLAGMRLIFRGRVSSGYFATLAQATDQLAKYVPISSDEAFISSVEILRSLLGRSAGDALAVG
jgi:serine/threonine protein kinase